MGDTGRFKVANQVARANIFLRENLLTEPLKSFQASRDCEVRENRDGTWSASLAYGSWKGRELEKTAVVRAEITAYIRRQHAAILAALDALEKLKEPEDE